MDSGSVKVDGKEIFGLKSDKLADYRKENLGFRCLFSCSALTAITSAKT